MREGWAQCILPAAAAAVLQLQPSTRVGETCQGPRPGRWARARVARCAHSRCMSAVSPSGVMSAARLTAVTSKAATRCTTTRRPLGGGAELRRLSANFSCRAVPRASSTRWMHSRPRCGPSKHGWHCCPAHASATGQHPPPSKQPAPIGSSLEAAPPERESSLA